MIKIINNTDLYYQEIGEIIDNINWDYKKEIKEQFHITIKYKRRHVEIYIKQMKKYVEWRFDYE